MYLCCVGSLICFQSKLQFFKFYLLLLSFSYMYAVAMGRNLEVQVENKLVRQYRVQEYVPATAREVQSAYSKLMEVCTISKYH